MHVFADSSKESYAVVCFGSFMLSDNTVFVKFLFGKSKVGTVSGLLTIPHLELVAAALSICVSKSFLPESNMKFDRVVYWPDSLAALHLLNDTTRRFNVLVDAHLAEIRAVSSNTNWRYCPTLEDPADIGTRVIFPKNKKKFLPWINGPEFLYLPENKWPVFPNSRVAVIPFP